MNYHNILHDDMLNGEGLRVVLFVSGCSQHCKSCQNEVTWNKDSGILFDKKAEDELFEALKPNYISGITFSGGHPLEQYNQDEVLRLIKRVRRELPDKNIWLYTGYTWEQIQTLDKKAFEIVKLCDVVADGRFMEELKDNNLHWVGSSNQRVIDVKRTLEQNRIILLEGEYNV